MWHGPLGLYGWVHDEERDGERRHLFYPRMYLHGIPRAFLCRRFGHRPVVDGYGTVPADPAKPWREAKRWVACGRCDERPAWQGDLPPALFPKLGAPYDGDWVDEETFATTQRATERRKEEWYQQVRAQRDSSTPGATPMPVDIYPVWPSEAWDRPDAERLGPRGAVSVEAPLVPRRWHGWPGFGVGFSLGAGERPIKFHVHAGPLGSVYVGFERYGAALAHRLLGRDLPETRVFEVAIDGMDREWTLHWQIAARRNEWSSRDPKWMHGRVNFAELLLGKASSSREAIDTREVLIPLPEGRYPATVTLERVTWQRTRTRPTVTYTADVKPACGVPVPGKGENSYDCGDDATYGQTCGVSPPEYGSEWVTQAVEKFIGGIMRDRSRYGSGLDWVPDAGWPEQCVRS